MREKKTITEEIPTVAAAQESAVRSEKPAVQEEKPKPKRPGGRPPKAKAQADEKPEMKETAAEPTLQPVPTADIQAEPADFVPEEVQTAAEEEVRQQNQSRSGQRQRANRILAFGCANGYALPGNIANRAIDADGAFLKINIRPFEG